MGETLVILMVQLFAGAIGGNAAGAALKDYGLGMIPAPIQLNIDLEFDQKS